MLKRFLRQEIAGRTSEIFCYLVDMVRVVLDIVLGAFDLSDETFRYTDSIRQHGL